ncbi:hypothetical protein [Nocardioides sp.]|uniref:hypothetical protein n=1 Tax=Nocardioides sp. TaxID=35761 RepID=UPI0035627900
MRTARGAGRREDADFERPFWAAVLVDLEEDFRAGVEPRADWVRLRLRVVPAFAVVVVLLVR